jgi:tetratricopeptide (TPR) repeat protein
VRTIRLVAAGLLAGALTLATSGVRPADAGPTPADAAFERGRALMTAHRYPEACAAFEESLRLDYQLGTLYNLATCDAQRGRLATALTALRKLAREDHNAARRAKAEELADQLGPRVPWLRVTIEPAIDDTELTLDGTVVDDPRIPLRIDLGSHRLEVTAPRRAAVRRTVEITREGDVVDVTLRLPAPAGEGEAEPARPPPDDDDEAPRRATPPRRLAGQITLGVGAGLTLTGLVVGGLTYRAWQQAQDDAKTDVALANREVDHVRTLGDASTALCVVGALAIGAGAYLWGTASHPVQATASLGADHATFGLITPF